MFGYEFTSLAAAEQSVLTTCRYVQQRETLLNK